MLPLFLAQSIDERELRACVSLRGGQEKCQVKPAVPCLSPVTPQALRVPCISDFLVLALFCKAHCHGPVLSCDCLVSSSWPIGLHLLICVCFPIGDRHPGCPWQSLLQALRYMHIGGLACYSSDGCILYRGQLWVAEESLISTQVCNATDFPQAIGL